eukprot:6666618-Pyramimonas_sp.AAC.1
MQRVPNRLPPRVPTRPLPRAPPRRLQRPSLLPPALRGRPRCRSGSSWMGRGTPCCLCSAASSAQPMRRWAARGPGTKGSPPRG